MDIETSVEIPEARFYWYKASSYYWEYKGKGYEPILRESKPYESGHRILHFFSEPPFLLASPESEGLTRWKPLEDEPGLFFEFATVEPTEEGILGFANEYGPLANSLEVTLRRKGETQKVGVGDPLEFWVRELERMSTVVSLWIALENNDTSALAKVIEWSEDKDGSKLVRATIDTEWGPTSYVLFEDAGPDSAFRRLKPGDLRLPARGVILYLTNEQLANYPVHLRLGMEDSSNEPKSYYEPESLLSAMWLQFHNVAIGRNKFKQCPICHKWEDVTNKSSRWTKHPKCANRQRAREHYERTKKGNNQATKKPARKPAKKAPAKKTPAAKKATTSKGGK